MHYIDPYLMYIAGAISCGDIVEAIHDEDAAVEFCQNFDLSREGQIG